MTRNAIGPVRVAVLGGLFLAILALTVPIDHDEGQYLAATRLVAEGWHPILDFPYLQTPLQPYILAPLQWLTPGWLLISSRLANAVFVGLAAWLTGRTAEALSGKPSTGVLAALLLLFCDSVQFAGSVARNDALPFLLLAVGVERLWSTPHPGHWRMGYAGLALAAAASCKISYALPAAAIAATTLFVHGRTGPGRVLAMLGGMVLGAFPTLIILAAAPRQGWFGMVAYSVDAVEAFQTLKQTPEQLSWPVRLARFAKFAALGPLLFLLVLAALTALRRRCPDRSAPYIGPLLIASLVAALLPMPAYRQYLVPLVIPLLLWLAARGSLGAVLVWRRPVLVTLLVIFAVAGTFRSAREAITIEPNDRPLAVAAEARAIGTVARQVGAATIASLDAVRATDSGLAIDRRFATGPFLFRAGNLDACRDTRLCPVTFANLAPLERHPPNVIVTGSEARPIGPLEHGLDGVMAKWADQNGAKPVTVGQSVVWLMPKVSPMARVEGETPPIAR